MLLMVNEDQEGNGGMDNLSNLDRWILSRLSRTVETVNTAFTERNFYKAVFAMRQFLHYEFCDFYLVNIKKNSLDIYIFFNTLMSHSTGICLRRRERSLVSEMPTRLSHLGTRTLWRSVSKYLWGSSLPSCLISRTICIPDSPGNSQCPSCQCLRCWRLNIPNTRRFFYYLFQIYFWKLFFWIYFKQ